MRSSRFSPLAGMMAVAMMAATPAVAADEYGDTPERAKEPPPPRKTPDPRAPKVLTEADNTRLREAAEKRFRKAQRQAKGCAGMAALGPSTTADSGRTQ